jgi:hypothetical protein
MPVLERVVLAGDKFANGPCQRRGRGQRTSLRLRWDCPEIGGKTVRNLGGQPAIGPGSRSGGAQRMADHQCRDNFWTVSCVRGRRFVISAHPAKVSCSAEMEVSEQKNPALLKRLELLLLPFPIDASAEMRALGPMMIAGPDQKRHNLRADWIIRAASRMLRHNPKQINRRRRQPAGHGAA